MAVSFVAVGAASSAQNSSVTPGAPAGSQVGDVYLAFITARSTTATYATPTNWTQYFFHRNGSVQNTLYLFWKEVTSAGEAPPTFVVSGNGLQDTTIGQVACFRGVSTTSPIRQLGTFLDGINTQNIGTIPGLTGCLLGNAAICLAHKADDWTSVATLTADTDAWVEIAEPDETSGNDAGLVWDYLLLSANRTLAGRSFTVTGGGSNVGCGVMLELAAGTGPQTLLPSPVTIPLSVPAVTRSAGAITKTPSPVAVPLALATPTVTNVFGARTPSPVALTFAIPSPTILRVPPDTAFVYTPAKEQLGRAELTPIGQDWRVLLVAGNTTAQDNPDAQYIGDITTLDEFDGANYARKVCIDLGVIRWDSQNRAYLRTADLSWGALGPGTRPIANAVLYRHLGADAANPLIALLGRGGAGIVPDGRTLTLHWNTALGPIAIS